MSLLNYSFFNVRKTFNSELNHIRTQCRQKWQFQMPVIGGCWVLRSLY